MEHETPPPAARAPLSAARPPDREPLLARVPLEKALSVETGPPRQPPARSRPAIRTASERDLRPGDCEASARPALHVQFRNGSAAPCAPASDSASSGSDEEYSLAVAEARPPDGGWGWVVVFASFIINLIADGVTFSFGVIYIHFLEYFGEGKAKTSWIGSLFMAMPMLSGPIASFLTDRYGCRLMTIVGSVLACAGFVISSFVTSMEALLLTFGVMAGFGLSLCYVAAVVVVAYYFDRRRSLATGLSVCGSGIGTFIFAPLTQVLLDEYGWRGTTLILAGLFLNMAVCGALMRDLPWTTTMIKAQAEDRKRSRELKRAKRNCSSAESFSDERGSAAGGRPPAVRGPGEPLARPRADSDRQFSSLVDLPTFVNDAEGVPLEVLELMSNRRHVYGVLLHNYPGLMAPSRSFSDGGRLQETGAPPPQRAAPDDTYLQWLRRAHAAGQRARALPNGGPKPPSALLKDLRMHRHSLTYRGAMLNISRYRLRASSCPNIFRNATSAVAEEKERRYAGLWDLWDLVVDVLDFSHFLNSKFLLFAVSNFLLYTWYDVPYVYIADHALALGFTETDSSMLISIIGIVNMFGEIMIGWAGDWQWVDASTLYAVSMVLCGAVTALLPLLRSYAPLAAAAGAFGLFIAANYSLTSIILVELISLDRFTNAYGLLLLVQGVANLVGPPLAGWLWDLTGSYDLSFYFGGIFIAISGLSLFILPATKKVKRYQAERKDRRTPSASTSSVDENVLNIEAGLGGTITVSLKSQKDNKIVL